MTDPNRVAFVRGLFKMTAANVQAAGVTHDEVVAALRQTLLDIVGLSATIADSKHDDEPLSDEQVESLIGQRTAGLVAGGGLVRRLWLTFDQKNEQLIDALVRLRNAEEELCQK